MTSQHAERKYLHTYTVGVLLPLTQATITAVVVGCGVYVIASMVLDMLDPHKPALACGVLAWMVSWLYMQRRWLSLTAIERALHVDLNGDGVIGDVEPEDVPRDVEEDGPRVRIQINEIKNGGHLQMSMVDLPTTPDKLSALAAGLLNGIPFSEKQWAGKGKPFSSPEFRGLRAEMIKRGLVAAANVKDPRQGYALTLAGRAVMKHYADPHALHADEE